MFCSPHHNCCPFSGKRGTATSASKSYCHLPACSHIFTKQLSVVKIIPDDFCMILNKAESHSTVQNAWKSKDDSFKLLCHRKYQYLFCWKKSEKHNLAAGMPIIIIVWVDLLCIYVTGQVIRGTGSCPRLRLTQSSWSVTTAWTTVCCWAARRGTFLRSKQTMWPQLWTG